MNTVLEYIDKKMAFGEYSFTLDELDTEYGARKTQHSIIIAINRLVAKRIVASPAKGFYVIVPPEERIYGCLPPEDFIDNLMRYWQKDYYVGLLSAAQYYGASHQKPQVFQVISNIKPKQIHCGNFQINFIYKKNVEAFPVEQYSRTKSIFKISTPEVTAIDLINYPKHSGGLNNIVTVLSELSESIDADEMIRLIKTEKQKARVQRLGFLFEYVGADKLAHMLEDYISKQNRLDYVLLAPDLVKNNNTKRNSKWHIIINTKIESDL